MEMDDKKNEIDEISLERYIMPSSWRNLVFRWPRVPVSSGFFFYQNTRIAVTVLEDVL